MVICLASADDHLYLVAVDEEPDDITVILLSLLLRPIPMAVRAFSKPQNNHRGVPLQPIIILACETGLIYVAYDKVDVMLPCNLRPDIL